jgi:hypothetical protein
MDIGKKSMDVDQAGVRSDVRSLRRQARTNPECVKHGHAAFTM